MDLDKLKFNPDNFEVKIVYPGECVEYGWWMVECLEGEGIVLHDGTENPQKFPGWGILIRNKII